MNNMVDYWRGHCLDCSFVVVGDLNTVLSKGCDHEVENPGHWVEKERVL